jgi:hypothetical protein
MPPDAPAGREGQRELDAAVAEEVMGLTVRFTLAGNPYNPAKLGSLNPDEDLIQDWSAHLIPCYSVNPWVCAEVEAEIARRGLQRTYCEKLAAEVDVLYGVDEWGRGVCQYEEDVFSLVTASPLARCRAALAAVRGTR